MFPQKSKLKLRSLVDFFDTAQKIKVGGITLFYRQVAKPSQWVVIVPKRTAQHATARTHLKRVFYQVLKNNWTLISSLQLQGVIVVHRVIDLEQFESCILQLLDGFQPKVA